MDKTNREKLFMIEEWKDIKGYEDLYKISNTGKVFSKRTNKILKHGYTNLGYVQVQLSYKGENEKYFKGFCYEL